MPIVTVNKPLGWTPLQVLDWLRSERPEWQGEPMTYAGRLDPMAEGVLLVLIGEDRFRKSEMILLEKTYVAEILLGVDTDCYDVLGLVQSVQSTEHIEPIVVERFIHEWVGDQDLPFPPFSSYKVNGAPLHYWAREGKLDQIEIPRKIMVVKSVDVLGHRLVSRSALEEIALTRVDLARGAFRQEETKASWKHALGSTHGSFLAMQVRCCVGSGTYIRALAHKLGQDLQCGAILISLVREQVDTYTLQDTLTVKSSSRQ